MSNFLILRVLSLLLSPELVVLLPFCWVLANITLNGEYKDKISLYPGLLRTKVPNIWLE